MSENKIGNIGIDDLHLSNIASFLISHLSSGKASMPDDCEDVLSSKPYLRDKPDAYDENHREIAEESYLYAQMASNAYSDKPQFVFPEKLISRQTPFCKGFGLEGIIFEVCKNDTLSEVVIAYRGTEGADLSDWVFGNIFDKQYNLADELYNNVRQQYPTTKIVATGHSLGGGLALHTSATVNGVNAYAFNPSYRIHRQGKEKKNRRIIATESGDILELHRLLWRNPEYTKYARFNCTERNNHSMYILARCLTHVAAIRNDDAVTSLALNRYRGC